MNSPGGDRSENPKGRMKYLVWRGGGLRGEALVTVELGGGGWCLWGGGRTNR